MCISLDEGLTPANASPDQLESRRGRLWDTRSMAAFQAVLGSSRKSEV